MDAILMQSPVGDSSLKSKKRKRKAKSKKQADEKTGAEIGDQMDDNLEALGQIMDCKVANVQSKNVDTDLTVQLLANNPKVDAGSVENLSEGSANKKKKKRQKKNKKKATIKDEALSMDGTKMDTGSTENLVEGNVIVDQSKMDTGSTENPAVGNVTGKRRRKKKRVKKAKNEDEVQSMGQSEKDTGSTENLSERNMTVDQIEMETGSTKNLAEENVTVNQTKKDTGSSENFAEGNVIAKRRKKKNKKKAKVKNEVECLDQTKMDTGSTENLAEGNVAVDQTTMDTRSPENFVEGNAVAKRRGKRKSKKVKTKNEVECKNQTKMDTGSTENLAERKETVDQTKMDTGSDQTKMNTGSIDNLAEGNLIVDQSKMDTGSIENLVEGNLTGKRKRKRKATKKAKIKDEVERMDQNNMHIGTTENLAEGNVTVGQTKMDIGSTEHLAEGNVTGEKRKKRKHIKKAEIKDEVQSMDQSEMDIESTKNLAEENVIVDQTEMDAGSTENLAEISIKKEKIKDEVRSMDQNKTDVGSTENDAEGNVSTKRKRKRKSSKQAKKKDEESALLSDVVEVSCYKSSPGLAQERCGLLARPMELDGKYFPSESQHIGHPNLMVRQNGRFENGEVENEITLDEGKGSAESKSVLSTCKVEVSIPFSSCDVKYADRLYPKIVPSRRKLLVLDVNGLLADIVMPPPKDCTGDRRILGREVFRRPFCKDFLRFCFQNFDVAIWSSRSKRIIRPIVDYLLGDLKHKLLFCWDMSHSTQTTFKTLENHCKPLVFKELRKIWDSDTNLPWKKGDYDESNTLLLDDSPYKALLNPLHTAIFPHSYHYVDKSDNSLGPGGNLRLYLEGLATCEDVQKYVKQHPFGQGAIDEEHVSWEFYAKVLHHMPYEL